MGKYRSVQQIEQCIRDVESEHGIPRHRVVVGGFSQGGAIALLTAYHANDAVPGLGPRPPLAGCVSLSGWWTLINDDDDGDDDDDDDDDKKSKDNNTTDNTDDKKDNTEQQQQQRQVINPQTPLFWAHGQYDDKVLFEQQKYGINKLQKAGVTTIESHQYPVGHEFTPKEIKEMADFLDNIWFPQDKEDE